MAKKGYGIRVGRILVQSVVDPEPRSTVHHQIGVLKNLHMTRDTGLRDPQGFCELAYTHFTVLEHFEDSQTVFIPDVHPSTENEPTIATPRMNLDPFAEEDEALRDDVRGSKPKHEEAPVANQVPPRPRAIPPHPSQRGPGEEPGLARITAADQGRIPVMHTL